MRHNQALLEMTNVLKKISPDVKLGQDVFVYDYVNLYRRCKIQSHSFICEGVTIEDEVMISHGEMFINEPEPAAVNVAGELKSEADWSCVSTLVKKGAAIGSNATILCGITIGERALVGAGAVVTKDVPPDAIVAGTPATVLRGCT